MAVLVEGTIPSSELVLNHAFETLPGVETECERVVRSSDEAVMPLLWVRRVDRDDAERAFADDPTVDAVSCLSDSGDDLLYRMEWADHVRTLLGMLTNAEATVLDAYGRRNRWELRLLYPDREGFSRAHRFCEDHGVTFDVTSIRRVDGTSSGRFGLTDCQHRALVLAMQRGYFEVPRETSLEELATELDVSHQALSERLRRATSALVADTVHVGESLAAVEA